MTLFTAEFGMGSGGSMSLWSPGKPVCVTEFFLAAMASATPRSVARKISHNLVS